MTQVSEHQAEVLTLLRQSPGEYISGRFLAEGLGLEREAVYHAISQLRQFGYRIESDRRLGYRYKTAPDLLLASEIQEGLKTKLFAKKMASYRTLGSTNEVAKQLADAGAPEGTLIVAEQQTRGKGRFGRSWHSPPRCGLYFTLILRPLIPPAKAPALSICAALGVVDTLRGLFGIEVFTKWPNDVLVNRKKVCGILTELVTRGNGVDSVIVGVGMNVNNRKEDFPKDLRKSATSLAIELGEEVSRLRVLKRFLLEFERGYLRFSRSGLAPFRNHYRECSTVLGRSVKIRCGDKLQSGIAEDIDEEGSLILRKGRTRLLLPSGEITHFENSF
jgi:BirA family biotin operon repressor/biotin-[acetyl-CoA-carboxylase] ligase